MGRDDQQPKVIVIERKKKKYSKDLAEVQRLERDVTRVSARIITALDKGMDTYRKARDESSREEQDGALTNFGWNMAQGISEGLKEASQLPLDLARGMRRKRIKRLIRKQLRADSRVPRLFRIR